LVDLDGVGGPELVAAATPQAEPAAAFVFDGAIEGDRSYEGAEVRWTAASRFGEPLPYDVAGAGDLDGDGAEDLVLRGYQGGIETLQTYLIHGGPTLPASGPLGITPDPGAADAVFAEHFGVPDRFGAAVAGIGDHDGDGFDDLVITGDD